MARMFHIGKPADSASRADDSALHIHGKAAGFPKQPLFLRNRGDQMVRCMNLAMVGRPIDHDLAHGQSWIERSSQTRQDDRIKTFQHRGR